MSPCYLTYFVNNTIVIVYAYYTFLWKIKYNIVFWIYTDNFNIA